MKSKVVSLLLFLTATQAVEAQSYSAEDFIYPLKGVAGLYSANFGELRPDHFHSGVDIKTNGVEGKEVVAVADGYVSRIARSPYGYGLVLYVTHYNGTTSVYGHLSRFRDDIAEYVERERYRTKQHSVNLFCNSKTFVVKQGDLIAYSGNSGSSSGPHLHYEIRENDTQAPVNLFAKGIITPKDNISPLMFKLHYIEVDTLQGVAHNAKRRSFDLTKVGAKYQVVGGAPIKVGRSGYFVLEASDRKNDVSNTFAIYSLAASLDGEQIFEYAMDRFTFARTRFCNSIAYYPIKIGSRNEVIRLAAMQGAATEHYKTLRNRGAVTTSEGEKRSMSIVVKDDCGNSSTLDVALIGKADAECFKASEVEEGSIINIAKSYNFADSGLRVAISPNTLYENTIFSGGITSRAKTKFEQEKALSPIYSVMRRDIPLQQAISVSIDAEIEESQRSKVGLICVGRSGSPLFIKGEYNQGSVTASSRSCGDYYVAVDTTAPKLSIGISEGANERGSNYFSCGISDDLSGTASYSATIDGEWIALNLEHGRLYHRFKKPVDGKWHKVVVKAIDGVGNEATVERNYLR